LEDLDGMRALILEADLEMIRPSRVAYSAARRRSSTSCATTSSSQHRDLPNDAASPYASEFPPTCSKQA
jgi:hypothetical protein